MVTILNILVLTVGMLSIITNGVLLIMISKDPLKCFRKRTTTSFIVSLAVADLLTGAFEFFMEMHTIYPFHSSTLTVYTYPISWITTQASFLTLFAMSLERFIIVKYPFDCRTWITKKRIRASIAVIWLISTILGALILLPHPQLAYVQFTIFIEFLLSIFLIVGFYTFILLRVRKSSKTLEDSGQKLCSALPTPVITRKTRAESVALTTLETNGAQNGRHGNESPGLRPRAGTNTDREGDAATLTSYMQRLRHNQQEKKLTAVVLLLVGVLIVTVLPYLVVTQICVGYDIFCECARPAGLTRFMYIYYPIELLNFAVNPLIYAWRLPQYRRTLTYVWPMRRRRATSSRS